MSPRVEIDRLTLRVPGLDEGQARVLARLVAERLVPGLLARPGARRADVLRVALLAEPQDRTDLDRLARRIAEAIGRTVAPTGPDAEAAP